MAQGPDRGGEDGRKAVGMSGARKSDVRSSEEARRYNQAVGASIIRARRLAAVRCIDLARWVKISREALYSYESGRTSCPPMVLARIAQRLKVSLDELLPVLEGC